MRLQKVDSDYAIAKIEEWGYPRDLVDSERHKSVFFAINGNEGFVWYTLFSFEDGSESEITWHLSFQKKAVFTMRIWAEMIALSLKAGALRIWSFRPDDVMRDYCLRLGFEQDDTVMDWYRFDLGE